MNVTDRAYPCWRGVDARLDRLARDLDAYVCSGDDLGEQVRSDVHLRHALHL